jgi:hypothetical protein
MEAVNVLVRVAVTVVVVASTDVVVVVSDDLRHIKTVFLVVCDPSMNKLLVT